MQELKERKRDLATNKHDTETFFRELQSASLPNSEETEIDIVGGFCSKDMFAGINDPSDEEESKEEWKRT